MTELLQFLLDHEEQFRRARLASLYSDFRSQRTTNPDGYAANISAWRIALTDATQAGLIPAPGANKDLLTLRTTEDLLRALETKEWGRPLALGTVIKEAIARKDMVPLHHFLTSRTSVYDPSWKVTLRQIVSWGLKHLGLASGASGEDKLSVGQFVILANVEILAGEAISGADEAQEAGRRVLKQVTGRTNRTDRIFSKNLFEKEFASAFNNEHNLTEADFRVLLTFLARDKHEIVYDDQTVKFMAASESITAITTQDTTIASLKTLIADLTAQVLSLTSRIDTLSQAARNAVEHRNRISAQTSLRSKKLAETALVKRSETLAQLEEVYSKIEQAADQVEVVKVMQASTGVLKGLHAEVGGVERVEDVVEELMEEMGKVDEMGNVINEIGQGNVVVDEREVDHELEAMERGEREERERKEAAETRRRLEAIKENNKAQRQKDMIEAGGQAGAAEESGVEESTSGLGRISLDEQRPSHSEEDKLKETNSATEALPAD
ncbi:MAG: hypothetical protein M1827_002286 [Pycnora praestabilis]|nr:MAG: hypothetical protein M1827_002286 [Pycnora praestabilis]